MWSLLGPVYNEMHSLTYGQQTYPIVDWVLWSLSEFFKISNSVLEEEKISKLSCNLMEIKLIGRDTINILPNSDAINDQNLIQLKRITLKGFMKTYSKFLIDRESRIREIVC